jgi:hypothetical protein
LSAYIGMKGGFYAIIETGPTIVAAGGSSTNA